MNFLQSRAERVAAHIREGILKREWSDPLPNTRDWARKLGVSPPPVGIWASRVLANSNATATTKQYQRTNFIFIVPPNRLRLYGERCGEQAALFVLFFATQGEKQGESRMQD